MTTTMTRRRRLGQCQRGAWRRLRSFVLAFLLSLFFSSFFLLLLLLPATEMYAQELTDSDNGSFRGRPRSCDACFHADFPLLVNQPQLCSPSPGQEIDIVFFIFTRPHSADTRWAIRNSWASVTRNNTSNFRHVFMAGYTQDAASMRALQEESRHFRDVVISEFQDSYNNLTLKTVTSLHWVTRFCRHARFFFKVDDDVWVNTGRLLQRLDQQLLQLTPSLTARLAGSCRMASTVVRSPSSKWYASYASYPEDKYPPYCSGVGYGGTLALAEQVLQVSPSVPFFHLEDVYVGLCLRELGSPLLHLDELNAHRGWDLCQAFSPGVITYHQVPPRWLSRVWSMKTCGYSALWRFLTWDFLLV